MTNHRFFLWLWYFWMWQLLFTKFTFWPCSQKEEKNSFISTSLLIAININDSGLCDNEFPPSLLRAGVTYPPMCRWQFAALLRLTYADAPEGAWDALHHWNWRNKTLTDASDCYNLEMISRGYFWTKNRAGMNQLHDESKNGRLSIGWPIFHEKVFPLSC